MTASRASALTFIRDQLRALDPTGDDGFEGLMATLLSRMTGLVMRLAKSGSQFGRDATTPVDTYSVGMEAKRYDDDLRLEQLAGKILIAKDVLAGTVDLYVLGATSAVGDGTQRQLEAMLEQRGITLLTLDWTDYPIPPLAVALAADLATTLGWLEVHAPAVDRSRLSAALDEVRADPAFATQAGALREAVGAASVGFEPLRRTADVWLERRFSDANASQTAFGQRVTVADSNHPPVRRGAALAVLSDAIQLGGAKPRVVAVCADEGAGKTWLVGQWWVEKAPRPVMLFIAGRRVGRLVVDDPLGSLATLLSEQEDGAVTQPAVASWRRRLERWKQNSQPAAPRIVVTLDGINERQSVPWADLIAVLAAEVHALGGLLVVTSRPAFWDSEVRPRLRQSLEVVPVTVSGYTDPELTAALATAGVRPEDLPEHVRTFVRNPRVCRVAVHVLRTLQVGFQLESPQAEAVLARDWGHGFLGEAATHARARRLPSTGSGKRKRPRTVRSSGGRHTSPRK